MIEETPYHLRECRIVEDFGIQQALLAVLRQFADFQIRDGLQLVLGRRAETPLVFPIGMPPAHDDARRQQHKHRSNGIPGPRAGGGFVFQHGEIEFWILNFEFWMWISLGLNIQVYELALQ